MSRIACGVIIAVVVLGGVLPAGAFIESPNHPPDAMTLSWVRQHGWIAVFKVDRVDADQGVVTYQMIEQLQGKACPPRIRHLVTLKGKVLPGVDKIRPGQLAVCFGERQYKLYVTYVQGSWYVAAADRDEPTFCRVYMQRPDLHCLFVGPTAELADAFRELAAGRDAMIRCRKTKNEATTQFVRCRPEPKDERTPQRRVPVSALQAVADHLPDDPAADAKKAVPALVVALRSDDPLVRATAAKLLREIDPEAAKRATER
jgi:hypothetical protein